MAEELQYYNEPILLGTNIYPRTADWQYCFGNKALQLSHRHSSALMLFEKISSKRQVAHSYTQPRAQFAHKVAQFVYAYMQVGSNYIDGCQ